MSEPPDKSGRNILITGATGAIGAALAEIYAQRGVTLHLHGRNAAKLTEVAERCRLKGAYVLMRCLDLRDSVALQDWLKVLEPLDLVIINAGVNTHVGAAGESEPLDEVEALVDVNLKAAMIIAHAVLPSMRERGQGQIAFVSSLAAYFGLPVTHRRIAPARQVSRRMVRRCAVGWQEKESRSMSSCRGMSSHPCVRTCRVQSLFYGRLIVWQAL